MKSNEKEENKKIFSYGETKKNIKSKNNININNKYIIPITLVNKNNEIDKSLKNENLERLRTYIKSPRPYLVTSSIRKKMKYIKIAENGALDQFYTTTIKTYSARHQKNDILKNYLTDNSNSSFSKVKPKKLNTDKFKLKNYSEDKFYKTFYKSKVNNSHNQRKRNSSNYKKVNFSNSKTDYSSLPTAAYTSRNFHPKSKYFDYELDKRKNYDDILGYNNANMNEPTYTQKGTLRSFMNEINNLRKDSYKKYCLKLYEFEKNNLYENMLLQIQLDERNKNIANYYLNKYNDGYNIYWYKLKKKINKEIDINDNYIYEIKSLKLAINKLTIKLQKLLIKLSIFEEIKEFLYELKIFSSYPFGTPYNQLSEIKNKLNEKIKNNEEQTNLNIYLLNKKDVGIDLFLEKYKVSLNNSNEKGNNKLLNTINEFSNVPDKLDSNIKNLLWVQNILEREIDTLKSKLYDVLEESKNEQIYERKILNQYNNLIKTISRLKTENKYLNYKVSLMKKKNNKDKYGKLNKNIITKIITIYNTFNKNGYIAKEDNLILYKYFPNHIIMYLLICLSIIEKNILYLIKFKKEVIYKDPILKKTFELNSKHEAVKRKKLKEQEERYLKTKNTIAKLNKVKFLNEQKDYYDMNRKAVLKKFEKESKKKSKDANRIKSSMEIIMDII